MNIHLGLALDTIFFQADQVYMGGPAMMIVVLR